MPFVNSGQDPWVLINQEKTLKRVQAEIVVGLWLCHGQYWIALPIAFFPTLLSHY